MSFGQQATATPKMGEAGAGSQSPSPALGEGFRVRAAKTGMHSEVYFIQGEIYYKKTPDFEPGLGLNQQGNLKDWLTDNTSQPNP